MKLNLLIKYYNKGPAVHIASKYNPACLILVSALASIC